MLEHDILTASVPIVIINAPNNSIVPSSLNDNLVILNHTKNNAIDTDPTPVFPIIYFPAWDEPTTLENRSLDIAFDEYNFAFWFSSFVPVLDAVELILCA